MAAARSFTLKWNASLALPALSDSDTDLSLCSAMAQLSRACCRVWAISGTFTAFRSFLSTTIKVPSRPPALRLASFIPEGLRIKNRGRWPRWFSALSAALGIEMLLDALPALVVIALQLLGFQRLLGGPDHGTGLEHEGHGVGDVQGFGGVAHHRLLVACGVGAVTAHAVVQRCAARYEAAGLAPFLGVVDAGDEAHELRGHVAVEPGGTEGVLRHQPAGREDHEVHVGGARRIAGRGQHCEDGWVWVIVADGADGIEAPEVVLVGRVVAVPADDVERRVVHLR